MTTEPTQVWASAEAAERWRRTTAQRQQAFGAATERLLDAAGLEPGFRVLDLAAGTGDTSLLAARRVGPAGSVLAVDISATMLQEAANAAEREGLTNIQTLVTDIVNLDLPPHTYDAAISRFGLMFLTDVVEGLRRIRLALKPNARLAALVWSTSERNPHIFIPLGLAEQFGGAPAEGSPMRRAAALGEPGVFASALANAGFTGIDVQAVATPREYASLDAAVEAMQLNSALLRQMLDGLDASEQQRVMDELRSRLGGFVQADGRCVVPAEALLGVATAS
ncbi:MAG TPA: methyltransferase domain-containing protein [Chloroflexota bacterium]|jgi:ubiquinone/menaquinone biosynthesis C-methylase UbiE